MKFSILLPTFNRSELLSQAIQTVLQQDYEDWEIIVSDNYSEEDLSVLINNFNDSRIKYYRTDKFIPVTENWNNALKYSSGDYMIMLGDDDGLMPSALKSLNSICEKYENPDILYTGAYLYAYPGVIPGHDVGFLRSYKNRSIYAGEQSDFELSKDSAIDYVNSSFNFRVDFDYNMQFFVMSKELIEKATIYGELFHSPYPDYYAANLFFLKAKKIIVVPEELVTIGISPKSFGYYYFNNLEELGNKYLNNTATQETLMSLSEVILPGSEMNTSWLIAMEFVRKHTEKEFNLKVNYQRYRIVQIAQTYGDVILDKDGSHDVWNALYDALTDEEIETIVNPMLENTKNVGQDDISKAYQFVLDVAASHPAVDMPDEPVQFNRLLDVYNSFS